MGRRITNGLRAAAGPTIVIVIAVALVFVTRWSKVTDDLRASLFAGVVLTLVVFLTYFVLGIAGLKPSPQGAVNVPRVYAWSLICAVSVLVFGALFYVVFVR